MIRFSSLKIKPGLQTRPPECVCVCVSGCVLRLDCDSRQGARAQQPSQLILVLQQPVQRLQLLALAWLDLGWVGLVFLAA